MLTFDTLKYKVVLCGQLSSATVYYSVNPDRLLGRQSCSTFRNFFLTRRQATGRIRLSYLFSQSVDL